MVFLSGGGLGRGGGRGALAELIPAGTRLHPFSSAAVSLCLSEIDLVGGKDRARRFICLVALLTLNTG